LRRIFAVIAKESQLQRNDAEKSTKRSSLSYAIFQRRAGRSFRKENMMDALDVALKTSVVAALAALPFLVVS
jgi:hypothetical protein